MGNERILAVPRSSPPPAGATARPGSHGVAVQKGFAGTRDGRGPEPEEAEVANVDRPGAVALLSRVAAGERLRERDKRGLTLAERLAVQRAERQALELMSPQERLTAYRRGQLSGYQLSVWWSLFPAEIPRIDDVPEWLAATLVDICEHPDYVERCNRVRAARLSGRPG